MIQETRSRAGLRALLGDAFEGAIPSDFLAVYTGSPGDKKQLGLPHSTTVNIRGESYRLKDRKKAGLRTPVNSDLDRAD